MCLLLAKVFLPKSKYIYFDHSPTQFLLLTLKPQFINKIFVRFALRHADIVASVSKEHIETTGETFGIAAKRLIYIYNPIDLETIQRCINEKVYHPWFVDHRYPVILSAARLDPIQKVFPTLLRAFSVLSRKINVRLVLLGTGPQESELKNLTKQLDLSDKVWFAGYQESPYKFIAKADVFVLSTKFEGFGLVLTEALSCGCPVISSDCDFGPREVLEYGEHGTLVPVGDVEKLSEAIEKLLLDQEISQQFIERGKNRAKEFTIERASKGYENLFRKLS